MDNLVQIQPQMKKKCEKMRQNTRVCSQKRALVELNGQETRLKQERVCGKTVENSIKQGNPEVWQMLVVPSQPCSNQINLNVILHLQQKG